MRKISIFLFNGVCGILLLLIISCGKEDTAKGATLKVPLPSRCIESIRETHPGDVLVLLFGKEGCPGTARATDILDDYMKSKPKGVSVLRIDVPLAGEDVVLPENWTHSFENIADNNRNIATKLAFFYYPTLYIFDKDNVLRFTGGCDLKEFPGIVKNILSEKSESKKVIYTKVMLKSGVPAPQFSGKTINGKSVTLRSLLGKEGLLLFFCRRSCSFSMKEFDNLIKILPEIKKSGVHVAVVVNDEGEDALSSFKKYSQLLPIISDREGVIFNKYVVSVTPYFYFIDRCSAVFSHRSFTKGAALNTVSGYMKNSKIQDSFNVQGAG